MKPAAFTLSLLCLASLCCAAEDLSVPLRVKEPVGVSRAAAPVRGGVPVEPLGVRTVKDIAIEDANGKRVNAQVSPLVTLENGTLSWVLVDFLDNFEPNEQKAYTLKKGRSRARVGNAVTAKVTDQSVRLSNGLLDVVLSGRKFNLFESIKLHGKEMLVAEQPAALTLVRGGDRKAFSTRGGKVDRVTLEDPGPVRTTVRIDGSYGAEGGETWLRWTARVTLWAGNPNINVLYAVRNVNPKVEEAAHIRQASLVLAPAGTGEVANYVVGAGTPHMSQISRSAKGVAKGSQWHNAVELEQIGPCAAVCSKSHRRYHHLVNYDTAGYRVRQFQPGKRKPIVDVGFRCDGWIHLDTAHGGCQLWLRTFTQDNPKRLAAAVDGTLTLDLIPVWEGNGQPYYSGGGYWLGDRSHRTYEFNVLFRDTPVITAADVKESNRQFHNYRPIDTPNVAGLVANVQRVRHPLQLTPTPEWLTRTGQLWGVVPSRAEEEAAAKAMGRKTAGPLRDLGPGEVLATDFIHYENFHYRSEWDAPRDAILEFLRTGEWPFYRRANSYARNYRDLGVPRTDGQAFGARARGVLNKVAAVPRWGKFCGCHNYGAGLLDMWLITGDRSYREPGVEYGYVHAAGAKAYGGFGSRNWGRKMASVLRTWTVTQDPTLKDWLVTYCRPRVPDPILRADGRALICGKHMSSWMVGLCSHAIWHNWVLNGNEYEGVSRDDYRDQLIGMARQVARYWWFDHVKGGPYHFDFDKPKPGDVTTNGGGGPYTLSCIDMITRGYLLTGDPGLLASARKFWDAFNGDDREVLSARLRDFSGMGSSSFWARQFVYAMAHPRTDALPPARTADLRAEALGGGRVRLTWTAPADRGGTVVAYQVKHAPCPVIDYEEYVFPRDHNRKWTWWAGYNVPAEPVPGNAGARESMTLSGISPGTHYFALRSRDDTSNESALSNIARIEVK